MQASMVTTALELPGYRVIRNIGIVRGIVVRSRSVVGESFRTDDRGPPSPLECRLRMGLLRHAQTTCCYSDKAPAGDFDLAQTHIPIFMAQSSFR